MTDYDKLYPKSLLREGDPDNLLARVLRKIENEEESKEAVVE